MKVAVLISGQIGEDKECFESINKNIIEPYKADTFVVYASDSPIISKEECIALWKPSSIYYGNYPSIIEPNINSLINYAKQPESNIESVVKMCYGIYTANEMKQKWEQDNGFVYDVVVRVRPDLIIEKQLEIKNTGDLWIPIGWDHRGGFNDTFAYGPSKVLNHYAGLYHNLWFYANHQIPIHPETLLKIHLDRGDFGIMRWDYPTQLRGMKLNQLEYRQK